MLFEMKYKETLKNTFLLDVLELLNIVTDIDSNIVGIVDTESSTKVEESATIIEEDDIESQKSRNRSKIEGEYHESVSSDGATSANNSDKKDPFLVDWNGPDDPDLPLNWSLSKKVIVLVQVMLLTCINYMGSSIYTPGQEQIQSDFHVGHVVGTLNLSVYVLGYGIGPIIFSPLSEVYSIGRQGIYIITFLLFLLLQIGCATVNNIAGLVILRFITGILCSPTLSTGGATVGDVTHPHLVPKILGLWAVGAVAAPVLAPLLGACMVVAKGWRWIFWLLLWMSAATWIFVAVCFPETSHENILHRRAMRLRKLTGDNRYYTKASLDSESDLRSKKFWLEVVKKPFVIIFKEPIVLAFDMYIALCYGCFYLFFEAFPIVFVGVYHFTLVEMGVAYMGFCVGCCLAYALLFIFQDYIVRPRIMKYGFTPEVFLILAMMVSWLLPAALFIFGWTAQIHWMLPIFSEVLFVLAVFNLFQATFAYLAACFPKHVASVFAGNGFCRAGFACAFPLFGQAMYNNLGSKNYPVGWGSSLVGFISVGLSLIPFVLYKYGATLRARSSFSG